jgi:hypothetical protein
MRMFVAKFDFNAHTMKGPEVVMNGEVFVVASVEDLPHPIGTHPAMDSDHFSENDKWAKNGDWKKNYDEYECALKKVVHE